MALALAEASKLKPDIRLAQAVSAFEAELTSQQKTRLCALKSSNYPPGVADVMKLTAEIDLASSKKATRCFGPRFTNVLHSLQQFAAVGDVVVGGSQNIIACGRCKILLSYRQRLMCADTYRGGRQINFNCQYFVRLSLDGQTNGIFYY